MHFYPHNIPDFNNATRHLTRVERSVYRDAIERYYDTEQPLTGDDFDRLARVLLCFSDEEKDALRSVLDEFFTLENGCYRHERCDTEIAKYRSNTTAKAKAGKASALARKNRSQQVLNGRETDEQLTNKQELITNNQELIINTSPSESVPAQSIAELFNQSFPELPKVKQLTDKRRTSVRRRWLENGDMQNIDRWKDFFEYVRQSDFLMGRTERPWNGFCFDWLFNPSNFVKIREGNYHK